MYRFIPEYTKHIPGMLTATQTYLGQKYDAKYEMDDEKIYCSELIWKAFKAESGIELSETERLGDLNWKPYKENQ